MPGLLRIMQRDEGRSPLWNIGASSQGSHADEALARKPRGQAPQLLQFPSGNNSLPHATIARDELTTTSASSRNRSQMQRTVSGDRYAIGRRSVANGVSLPTTCRACA
ncbi:hypothetical protein ALC53_05915 [Atta colombica]|uniref:Uncharacterized protein n=1 Tax=Atta colombica TaxID=520822 RepID=A0A195BFX7_9HYME|nr:hypothetical protein ALC53_05915 [Atta colombica]